MRAPKGIWGYAGGVRRLHVGPHEGLQGALRYVGSIWQIMGFPFRTTYTYMMFLDVGFRVWDEQGSMVFGIQISTFGGEVFMASEGLGHWDQGFLNPHEP